jgi:L-fuconolactonase
MVIDSHQHFWRYDPIRDGWITDEMASIRRDFMPEHLLPELRANQVDGCVAVQVDQSERETMFLLDLARQHSFIRGVVGWIDLRSPSLTKRLEFFSQFPKLRGFRHIAQAENDRFLLGKDFLLGVRQLQPFGFTYDILIYARQLPAAMEFASTLPGQRFVLNHIAKPGIKSGELSTWERSIRELGALPNVYCKLSGLITEADWRRWRPADLRPYLDVVFDCFGAERLMFGSDWPVCLLAGSYRQVRQIIERYTESLTLADKDKIFALNACRFYGLETQ